MLVRIAGTIALALGFFSHAQAATSDWATAEGGRMRLVAAAPDADGAVRAVLQIEPGPGWITYWREPGESGIPPQVAVVPDSRAKLEKIGYPVPKLIALGAIREIGYDAPISLPLHIKTNGEGKLDVTAFIGLCKNVCIPFQAALSLTLPAAGPSAPAEAAILTAADAALPQAPAADFMVRDHSLSADGKALSLRLALPDSGDSIPQIYVTGPSGFVFFKQASASRHGGDVEATITIGKLPKTYVVHGKSWGILVVDGNRAMETTLAFE